MRVRRSGTWLAFILAIHVAILAWGAQAQSPTVDEIAYLPSGLSHWRLGNFELANVSPPLIPSIAAAPLLLVGAETNWSQLALTPHAFMAHDVGCDFLKANGARSLFLFTLARWVLIPFSVLGAVCCYLWARDLAGQKAGLLSASLWCFCPNILAHAQLVTADAGATSLGIAAAYTFWRCLIRRTWTSALLAGITLGFAESAKTTLLIFLVLWPLLWLASTSTVRRRLLASGLRDGSALGGPRQLPTAARIPKLGSEWKPAAFQLAILLLAAWYILNAVYAFDGCFKPLGHFRFVSRALVGATWKAGESGNRFAQSWVGAIPAPLPEQYLLGLDTQKRDLENIDPTYNGRLYRSYLRGVWSTHGWWYYYLYGFGIKLPLGTLILIAIAVFLRFQVPGSTQDLATDLLLLAPPATILILVSSQTGFNAHFRYALPILPFAFVWASSSIFAIRPPSRLRKLVVAAALSWSIASSLWAAPHHLSYFNELAGGPLGGHRHLLDSNIDWGQDLLFLKTWIDVHPDAQPLNLAYLGLFPPELIGLSFPWPPPLPDEAIPLMPTKPPPGWYAISIGYVRGDPFNGDKHLKYFLRLKPIAHVGYSLYIYHVRPAG